IAAINGGIIAACLSIAVVALAGYISSLFIPEALPTAKNKKVKTHFFGDVLEMFKRARADTKPLFSVMIASGWFFFLGAMYLSQLPNYTAQSLGVGTDILTFFLIVFSLGIGLGGLCNEMILNSKVDLKFISAALIGIIIFSVDLYFATLFFNEGAGQSITHICSDITGVRIMADLFLIAFFAGLYIVPIKAYLQVHASKNNRARMLAANGLLDSIFILVSALLAIVMIQLGFEIYDLFLALAVVSLPVLLIVVKISPLNDLRIFKHE
ncbi:MAG: hypothetical protein AAF244_05355, partial [Pseudomonadota bacterium]